MLKVWALRHSKKLDNQTFQAMLSFIDEDKKSKILKLYKWQDAERSLLGNFLVRAALCEMLQIKNEDIRIKRNKMGKPYADNIPQVFFNISHSGDWIVGVLDSFPVGIDIEQIKDLDLDMAGKILDRDDFAEMMKQKESQRPEYFYRCWTFNESYMKMRGRGISIPLSGVKKITEKAFFKTYPLDADYMLAVCSISGGFPENVILADINKLLQSMCTKFS